MKFGLESLVILLFFATMAVEFQVVSSMQVMTCPYRWSPCFRRQIRCPNECPLAKPWDPNSKGCFLDCGSPTCEAVCRHRKPNCNSHGSGCYDPRFIGGDGGVFYFHGMKNEHFTLVSDSNFQINARFIGLRPAGRPRDFTWMQALGIVSGPHTFTVEAMKANKWDEKLDHLKFSYNGVPLFIPEGHLSEWKSADESLGVERTGMTNSVAINLRELAEVRIQVVPVTKEDDRIHSYHIPSDDCYAHLEVQFRFYRLSPEVEGVVGKTYRPDYENPVKKGVPMPVVGGEDKYRTSSLVSSDCRACVFTPAGLESQ